MEKPRRALLAAKIQANEKELAEENRQLKKLRKELRKWKKLRNEEIREEHR